jgi:hypothetical protein
MNDTAHCWWASTILYGECRIEKLMTAGPATGRHSKEHCMAMKAKTTKTAGKKAGAKKQPAKAMKASSSSTKKSPAKKAGAKKSKRA